MVVLFIFLPAGQEQGEVTAPRIGVFAAAQPADLGGDEHALDSAAHPIQPSRPW